jgi:ABC-type amino acid transport substrate-binding protein
MVSKLAKTNGLLVFSDWDYDGAMELLKSGTYAAIVGDYGQIAQRVQEDKTCRLQMLPDDLGKISKGFAFRVNFTRDYGDLVERINAALLELKEEGEALVRSSL